MPLQCHKCERGVATNQAHAQTSNGTNDPDATQGALSKDPPITLEHMLPAPTKVPAQQLVHVYESLANFANAVEQMAIDKNTVQAEMQEVKRRHALVSAGFAGLQSQLAERDAELEECKGDLEDMQNALEEAVTSRNNMLVEKNAAEAKVSTLEAELKEAKENAFIADKAVERLNEVLKRKRADEEQHATDRAKLARVMRILNE